MFPGVGDVAQGTGAQALNARSQRLIPGTTGVPSSEMEAAPKHHLIRPQKTNTLTPLPPITILPQNFKKETKGRAEKLNGI